MIQVGYFHDAHGEGMLPKDANPLKPFDLKFVSQALHQWSELGGNTADDLLFAWIEWKMDKEHGERHYGCAKDEDEDKPSA